MSDSPTRIVLGMGAGHCGLGALAAILARQPGARVTVAQAPLLPWVPHPGGPGIRERIARWKAAGGALVGDVAAFYLPYAEAAVEVEPEVRIICLKRPEAEVAAAFRSHLDAKSPLPLNHWARDPAPPWTHHPLLTRTYPQYDVSDRDEGLALYWREYYARADELQARHPANVRVVDSGALMSPEGVRALLDFAGVPREAQVLATGGPVAEAAAPPKAPVPKAPHDPRRCVVLVPHAGSIVPECEDGLRSGRSRST